MSRDGKVVRPRKDEKIDSFFSLEQLNVVLGQRAILTNLDLTVPCVSGVGIVGLSGSGKTTLVRCLLGLVHYTGHIKLLGEKISTTNNINLYRRIGVLFQQAALFNDLTVKENCAFSQELSKDALRDDVKIKTVLQRLNLWEARDLLPRQLSGGMRHRAGLARTLVRNSECLILDEPTTGQDEGNAKIIQEFLLDYQKENQGRLIIISHDHDWLKPLIQWSVLIHEGKIAYQGPKLMTMNATQGVV